MIVTDIDVKLPERPLTLMHAALVQVLEGAAELGYADGRVVPKPCVILIDPEFENVCACMIPADAADKRLRKTMARTSAPALIFRMDPPPQRGR